MNKSKNQFQKVPDSIYPGFPDAALKQYRAFTGDDPDEESFKSGVTYTLNLFECIASFSESSAKDLEPEDLKA